MNENINNDFEVLFELRKKLVAICENHSLEQLNTIPEGYSNNIIWNIVHVMVSTDLLTYGPAQLEVPLMKWADAYRKGTNPDPNAPVSESQLQEFKTTLLESNQRLKKDYANGVFKQYEVYSTQFGVKLTSIEYAISYAMMHEMLHLGYVMAQRKLV